MLFYLAHVTAKMLTFPQITEEKLRRHLGEGLLITDCSLKYSSTGVFRRFAFLGFKSEEDAATVIKKFDKSYINTTQISVMEICLNLHVSL